MRWGKKWVFLKLVLAKFIRRLYDVLNPLPTSVVFWSA